MKENDLWALGRRVCDAYVRIQQTAELHGEESPEHQLAAQEHEQLRKEYLEKMKDLEG